MTSPILNIDLHCHSTVSDGALARARWRRGRMPTAWMSGPLTDHDEIGGLAEAAGAARELGMRFATGVEISVTWAGLTVHVVGLRFDPSNVALAEGLRKTRAGPPSAPRIGERLAGMGMPGAYEGALPFAGNPELISARTSPATWSRPAIARMCRPSSTSTWATIAPATCRCNGPRWPMPWAGYARRRAPSSRTRAAKYTPLQFAALFDEFIELGGEGIEVNTGSHTADEARSTPTWRVATASWPRAARTSTAPRKAGWISGACPRCRRT